MNKTLYKLTNTGKTQFWQIEVKDGMFRTTTGQVGGKSIQSKWTICKTKNVGQSNATSISEQAIKEAEAKITKKMEKGYSLDIKKAGRPSFFEPMLAKSWEDRKDKVWFPVFSQPKLDGIRCIVNRDGMWTRNGKKIVAAPHIFEACKSMFIKHPEFVFDGELYNHELKYDFNKITSLVKKTKPTGEDLEESKRLIQYHIYDCYEPERPTAEFNDRIGRIYQFLDSTNSGYLKLVRTVRIGDQKTLDEFYGECLEDGYEGQMIRVDGPYENKRSQYLLKRKEFMTEEFTILEVEEGDGNKTGMAASVLFENKNGKKFNSNVKGSFEFITELWKNRKKLIGKEATVRFQNYTPDGIPRFPYVIAIRDYE